MNLAFLAHFLAAPHWFLTCGSEAKSAHLLCQALLIFQAWIAGSLVLPPPSQDSLARSLLSWVLSGCPNLRSL